MLIIILCALGYVKLVGSYISNCGVSLSGPIVLALIYLGFDVAAII